MADPLIESTRKLVDAGCSPDQVANGLGISKEQANWLVEQLFAERRRKARLAASKYKKGEASIFSSCQYLTDPKKRDFCGKPTFKRSSWCAKHFDICCAG